MGTSIAFRPRPRQRWISAQRLLVVRADNIGDVVMAGPALRAIRETAPKCHLALLASPAGAQAACLLPWLDEILTWRALWLELDVQRGLPVAERQLVARLAAGKFDGAIMLTSFSQSPHAAATAAWLAGIPLRAGASRELSAVLTDALPKGPVATHQVERNLRLVEALGYRSRHDRLELAVPAPVQASAQALLCERGIPQGTAYVLVNAGASAPARSYPYERMARAARQVAAMRDLRVVLSGHERDRVKTQAMRDLIGHRAVDLAGATTVAELAALVQAAALVLTHNTALLHLADAFCTPVVAVYAGTDFESQWQPRAARHRLLRRDTSCSPCYAIHCPRDHACVDIPPAEVAAAALALLDDAPRERSSSAERIGSTALFASRTPADQRIRIAEDAVAAFWDHYERNGRPLRSSITRLADIALARDVELAHEGTRILFEGIIEPLCDAFETEHSGCYERVFAQIVMAARRKEQCRTLHAALMAHGLMREQDLWSAAPLRTPRARHEYAQIVVLSRLTLGADVAISVPLLERLKRRFPKAELMLLGDEGAGVLCRCLTGVGHLSLSYGRMAALAERLAVWPKLAETLAHAASRCTAAAQLVVDPDSRLTQLGLLRPVESDRYWHFPSRTYGGDGHDSLSLLVERWLDERLGNDDAASPPKLSLPPSDAAWSQALRTMLTPSPRSVACVSFGVGGNARKRIGLQGESRLLAWIACQGWRVLLVRGADRDEVERSYTLCKMLAQHDITVRHLPRGRTLAGPAGCAAQVVTWEGDLAGFMAAIAAADVYVGYDSAGQHLAAALGVPTLSLFVEAAGPRHGRRWTPRGRAPIRVVRSAWPPSAEHLEPSVQAAFHALAAKLPQPP